MRTTLQIFQNIKYNKNKVMAPVKKSYAIIYFGDKKPLKRYYETSAKAFYDYREMGCTFVELFNGKGVKISSFPVHSQTND